MSFSPTECKVCRNCALHIAKMSEGIIIPSDCQLKMKSSKLCITFTTYSIKN